MKLEKGNILTRIGRSEIVALSVTTSFRYKKMIMSSQAGQALEEKMPAIGRLIYDLTRKSGWRSDSNLGWGVVRVNSDVAGTFELGLFQVGFYPNQHVLLGHVRYSTQFLFREIITYHMDDWPTGFRIDLEIPNIVGKESHRKEVLSILELLPDCVHVWEYDPGQSQLTFLTGGHKETENEQSMSSM